MSGSSRATRSVHSVEAAIASDGVPSWPVSTASEPSTNRAASRRARACASPSLLPNSAYSVWRLTPAARATSPIRDRPQPVPRAASYAASRRAFRTGDTGHRVDKNPARVKCQLLAHGRANGDAATRCAHDVGARHGEQAERPGAGEAVRRGPDPVGADPATPYEHVAGRGLREHRHDL